MKKLWFILPLLFMLAPYAAAQNPATRIIKRAGFVAGVRGDTFVNSSTGVAYMCKSATCASNGTGWASMDASTAMSLPESDATAFVKGSADATKLFRFEADTNVPTGTTIVGTLPASSFTFARTDAGQTFTGAQVISSNSATVLTVGPNGATNPAFTVNASAASAATGVEVTAKAAGAGAYLRPTSSGGTENLRLIMKGAGGFVSIREAGDTASLLSVYGNTGETILSGNGVLAWASSGTSETLTFGAGLARNGDGLLEVNSGARGTLRDLIVRKHYVDATNTAAGTTGNQTINKAAGTVNIAAGNSSVTVTSSLVSANSIIAVMARTNDATCSVKNYVPAAGSFTVNMTANCTAETSVGFIVSN